MLERIFLFAKFESAIRGLSFLLNYFADVKLLMILCDLIIKYFSFYKKIIEK